MFKSESLSRPLRIGILVYPGQTFEQWEISLFERLERHPDIQVEAFLECPFVQSDHEPPFSFRLLSVLEKALFLRSRKSGSNLTYRKPGHIPSYPAKAFDTKSGLLDVVLSHVPAANFADPVTCGKELWEYHFYADTSGLHKTFGFHESMAAHPVTPCGILRRNPDGSREVVASCTTNTKFNGSFNAHYAKDKLPALVERGLLRKLHKDGRNTAATFPASLFSVQPLEIGWQEVLRYGAIVAGRTGRRLANKVLARIGGRPDNWSLVVSEGDVLSSSLNNLRELPQPKNELRADPFLFNKDGEKWVFFESWDKGDPFARICVGRMEGDRIEDITKIELGDAHVSYPYVFEKGGEIFLIPEINERNRVEIWRCIEFPEKWVLHATALEGKSPADTFMVEWDGQWWMFTNLCSGSILDHCMELHIYRVDGPDLQRIEPHPLNPVVFDTTSARNAGRPFVRDRRLIRPAQITSHGLYGYGLKFMEITQLSMEAFSEREIRRIEPDRDQATTGCHHLDSCEGFFIMDVRRAYGAKLLGARPIALKAS